MTLIKEGKLLQSKKLLQREYRNLKI